MPRMLAVVVLFLLAYAFYLLAVWQFKPEISLFYHLTLLILFLVFYVVIGIYLYAQLSAIHYFFYKDGVEMVGKKHIFFGYEKVTGIAAKKNIWDHYFQTMRIQLSPEFSVPFVEESNQFYFSLQKLIQQQKQRHVPHKVHTRKMR
ncbi:hypothetical protein HYS48_04140 [Candidatus Woesearchaeota archaeon]|nr:hypothetical protein [Candidatus Woesearchaeota archaeon]